MNHKHLLLFQLLNSSMTFLLIREFKTYISIVNFVRIQKSKTEGSISCFISFCVLYRKEQFFSCAMEKHNQIIVLQLSRVINEDRMKWNRDNVDKQHFSAVNMLLLFYHSLPRLLLVPSTISRHFFGKHLNFFISISKISADISLTHFLKDRLCIKFSFFLFFLCNLYLKTDNHTPYSVSYFIQEKISWK